MKGLIPFLEQVVEDKENYEATLIERHFTTDEVCPDCHGARLQPSSLQFKIDGKNISEVSALSLSELQEWLEEVKDKFSEKNKIIAHEILKEIQSRLGFLLDVGLDYLSLSHCNPVPFPEENLSVSVWQLRSGSQLVNVLIFWMNHLSVFISVTMKDLSTLLRTLEIFGNSVIVVEHDKDMILEADHVLDIGPKAGKVRWRNSMAGKTR